MKKDREIGLDLLRGIALITIVINHVPTFPRALGYSGFVIPTPTTYGFSSAAEIFVAISGYMVGLVYASKPHYAELLARRSARLYLLNLLILCSILPLLLFASSPLLRDANLLEWRADPGASLLRFLTFQSAPKFLDVLQLYEILMLVAIPAVWLLRRSSIALLTLSVLVYAGAQTWAFMNLPIPAGVTFWVPAWQVLFIIPMVLGKSAYHVKFSGWARSNLRFAVLPLLILVPSAFYVKFGARLALPGVFLAKATLHPLRILHATTLMSAYAFMICGTEHLHRSKAARMLAQMGSRTLACFLASIVTTYYVSDFIFERTGGLMGYLFVLAVVLTTVLASARYSHAWKFAAARSVFS